MTPTPRYVEKGERDELRRGIGMANDGGEHEKDVLALCDALDHLDAQVQEGVAREARVYEGIREEREALIRESAGLHSMLEVMQVERDSYAEKVRKWDEWTKLGVDPIARVGELVAERDSYREDAESCRMMAADALRKLDSIQRENAALREALKLIRDCTGDGNAERVAENALAQLDASVQIPPPDPTIMDYVPGTEPRDAKEGE